MYVCRTVHVPGNDMIQYAYECMHVECMHVMCT